MKISSLNVYSHNLFNKVFLHCFCSIANEENFHIQLQYFPKSVHLQIVTRVISYNSLVFSIDFKLLAISTFKRFDCQSSQLEPDITALFAGPSWRRGGGQATPDQPLPGAHRHGGHASQKVGALNNDIPSKFHEIDHSKVDR